MTLELTPGIFRIEISRLPKTGMFLGICQSLKGLYVHGRMLDELEARIPSAIEHILKVQGYSCIEIKKLSKDDSDGIITDLIVRKYHVDFTLIEVIH